MPTWGNVLGSDSPCLRTAHWKGKGSDTSAYAAVRACERAVRTRVQSTTRRGTAPSQRGDLRMTS